MIQKCSTIELFKEDMKFSSGHFTVFSSVERENLHGHNFRLYASFTVESDANGITVDYRSYKDKIRALCKKLDEIVIIPGCSEHLLIEETDKNFHIIFNSETMTFLKRDIIVLPIKNVTVEELSNWFINQLTESNLSENVIAIKVKVFSSPGQSGSASWKKSWKSS